MDQQARRILEQQLGALMTQNIEQAVQIQQLLQEKAAAESAKAAKVAKKKK